MNTLKEIYDNYLVINQNQRKIEEKICDKNKSIARLEKQIEKLEKKRYADSWVKCIVIPLAEMLTPLLFCAEYEIYGPFGLRSETTIAFRKEKGSDEWTYSLSLTLDIELNDDNDYKGYYCTRTIKSVNLRYDTGKTNNEYQQGSIGWLNGMNKIEETLPLDTEEILKIIRKKEIEQ